MTHPGLPLDCRRPVEYTKIGIYGKRLSERLQTDDCRDQFSSNLESHGVWAEVWRRIKSRRLGIRSKDNLDAQLMQLAPCILELTPTAHL